jgi:hypothetical protein
LPAGVESDQTLLTLSKPDVVAIGCDGDFNLNARNFQAYHQVGATGRVFASENTAATLHAARERADKELALASDAEALARERHDAEQAKYKKAVKVMIVLHGW